MRPPPPLARGPVLGAAIAMAVVLTAVSGRYGYHRDELYFRMLRPAWGYVDQPPFTPLLARSIAGVVNQPWALRVPATLLAAGSVLVVALVTRELGGGRRAQALCAWAYAFSAVPLIFGHLLLTATVDLVVWPAVTLFVLRALLRDQPRWWLAAGALVGLSTANKLLVGLLAVALVAGLLGVGPRRALWSGWLLAGAVLALVLALPQLVFQATHDWPQLAMGAALSDNNAGEVRVLMWPFLLLMLGPPLVPVWVAGIVALLRRTDWRTVRLLVPAFAALLVLTFAGGGQVYYPFGLLAVLFAAGCVPVAELMTRSARWRRLTVAGVVVSAVVSALIALPLLPVSLVGRTPVPAMNPAVGDQVGWPVYVRQVASVVRALPRDEREHAVVVTSNYGEAGAVARYGPALGVPTAYSGQNGLYDRARPPDDARVVVMVGGQLPWVTHLFASCTVAARLDNGVDVDNEEQGQPVAVCREPVAAWSQLWPRFQHLD
jgi:4-amino-4-deoxy-L-arabinose transferase-like glycosyltransferase